MQGDWVGVSISLMGVDPNCEASNLITGAQGSPGIRHNDSDMHCRPLTSVRQHTRCRLGMSAGLGRGQIGAKKTPHTVSVAPKVSRIVA
jgi:hypothetical protein